MEKDVFHFSSSHLPFRQRLHSHTSSCSLSFAVRVRLPVDADCVSLRALSRRESNVHNNHQTMSTDCFGNVLCHHVKHAEGSERIS